MRHAIGLVLALIIAASTLAAQTAALLAPTGTLRSSFIASNPVQGRGPANGLGNRCSIHLSYGGVRVKPN